MVGKAMSAWDKRRLDEAARIKALIFEAGLTCGAIDRKYGLRRCAASDTLYEPNPAAERAIAAALRIKPENLWRTRYHADGRRRGKQDYSRPPTLAQRRKMAAAGSQEATQSGPVVGRAGTTGGSA